LVYFPHNGRPGISSIPLLGALIAANASIYNVIATLNIVIYHRDVC